MMRASGHMFLAKRERWRESRTLFLLAVSSGTILNPLNSSMISIALHSIQHAFGVSFTTVSWTISAFYIASAAGQPIMGRLGDLAGRKRVFLTGLLLAATAAVAAPFTAAFSVLVLLRVLQAVGTSAIYPSGMALVRQHITDRQPAALAVISIFSSVTVALGPTIGGFAILLGGWPALFTVNLPFLAMSFLLAWTIFPKETEPLQLDRNFVQRLDVPGIIFFTAGLYFLLSFLLTWQQGASLLYGIAGSICLLLFVWRELQTAQPFIDIRMFRTHPALTRVNLLFIGLNVYNYFLLFGLPTYVQDEWGLSIERSGLLMLFLSALGIIVSPLAARWVERSGIHPPLFLGLACLLLGAGCFLFFFASLTFLGMMLILSLAGIGYGLQNVSLQTAMLQAAPPEHIGTASGLFQTSRYLGAIVSSVCLGLIFGVDVAVHDLKTMSWILLGVTLACTGLGVRSRYTER